MPDIPVGKRHGRLVVIGEGEPYRHESGGEKRVMRRYRVQCDCGNLRDVTPRNFMVQMSCGCINRSRVARGCAIGGCDRPHTARGLCGLHYTRLQRGIPMDLPWNWHDSYAPRGCDIEGCQNTHRARGLCSTHYQQARRADTLNNAIF